MRVLVTGATGFIGSALCAELLDAGHNVAVLVRNADHRRLADLRKQLSIIRGDLSNVQAWQQELTDFSPVAVAHLAWMGVGGAERNDLRQIANIGWTAELIAAATAAGAKIFLGVGSQAEYGPKSGIISPDAEELPTTLYGEAKLATGRICAKLAAQHGMRFAWMRVFSTYGAGDHPHWMIPDLIGKLLRRERPALTRGEQLWDFLHVHDAALAMRFVLETDEACGVYNLGSGAAVPLRETIETVRNQIDPALDLGWGEIPYRPDQVMHLQADVKGLTALGWQPTVKLSEGLAGTVAWYRSNPWIYELE